MRRGSQGRAELFSTHPWIEVGARRWCIHCGCYQIRRNGAWRDDPDLTGPYPKYNPTPLVCSEPQGTAI
jgi:hypothetical protein